MTARDVRPGAADLIGIVGDPETSATQLPSDMNRLLWAASPNSATAFGGVSSNRRGGSTIIAASDMVNFSGLMDDANSSYSGHGRDLAAGVA